MENEKLLAWFGDPALKERVVLKMKEHRARDEIQRGFYQSFTRYVDGKAVDNWSYLDEYGVLPEGFSHLGCALGCTLPGVDEATYHSPGFSWRGQVEKEYGIDRRVADLIDDLFENQPGFQEAAQFAVDVIEAIPVGADLSAIACHVDGYDSNHDDCVRCEFNVSAYGHKGDVGVVTERMLRELRNAPVPDAIESI